MNDAEKYKKGLRWALAVIVLMVVVLVLNVAIPRDRVAYDVGYVDGWNGCVAKQHELLERAGLATEFNFTLPVKEGESGEPEELGDNIGIIS